MGGLTWEDYKEIEQQARAGVLQKYYAMVDGVIVGVALERRAVDSNLVTEVVVRFRVGDRISEETFNVVWEAPLQITSPGAMKDFMAKKIADALTEFFMRNIQMKEV